MSKKAPSISAKKKIKRTSKHVLQARQEKEQLSGGGSTAISRNGPASSSSSSATAGAAVSGKNLAQGNNNVKKGHKEKKFGHVKDPEEAATYLTEWKSSSATWKFQKNTQSWLIRHMYEADKVGKSSFTLLLDYLKGLEGKTTKERMKADATRRARRYKSWLSSSSSSSSSHNDNEEEKDTTTSKASKATESPSESNTKKAGSGDRKQDGDDDNNSDDNDDDELRWSKLDEHDKRKEYKRARKILELCSDIMK